MAIRILLYFGLLAVGWVLSNKGFIHNNLLKKISPIQTLLLFSLIFVMGIRVGMDKQVIKSIGQIGLVAAVFAVATSGFSIIFVYLARKKLFKDSKITGEHND